MTKKMRIAFVYAHPIKVISDGVRSQAMTWKIGLEALGNEVQLINMWNQNDWKSFDIVLLFSFGEYASDLVRYLYSIKVKIAVAPILDPCHPILAYKIYSHWGCNKLRLTNGFHQLKSIHNMINLYLVRSMYEKKYITSCFDIKEEQCKIIPLSLQIEPNKTRIVKENFCLHISLLADKRKNVKRLIDAAKKYNFTLILGGYLRNEKEQSLLKNWIRGAENIKYKGFLTKEEMQDLYARAKVFALPSINEGVGQVALDAAAMGCDIVITSIGGPKEYYKNMAEIVNPYSVDDIGEAIYSFLNGKTYQPELRNMIIENYSISPLSQLLNNTLKNL